MRIQQSSIRGSVLAITLIMSALIGLMLAAYLTLIGNQNRFTQRSQVWNNAVPVCEAGVEEALAHINYSGTTSNFAINGWQFVNTGYVKSRTNEDVRYEMTISTNEQPIITVKGLVRAPVQANYIGRTVQVKTKVNHRFPQAVLSKGLVSASGTINSFNSTNATYSTPSGQYDPAKAHDDATVATLSKTAASLQIDNATIYGKVATGPGGVVSINNGSVGTTAWVNANKGIQSGYATDDMNVYIPDARLPEGWGGTLPPLVNQTIGGILYLIVLRDGDYEMSSLTMSGSQILLVQGKVRLWVKGDVNQTGSAVIKLDTGATLEMYVSGTCKLAGNGVQNVPSVAKNFSLIGLPTCTSITYSGGSEFIGTIYAPQATVSMGGNSEAVGAFVANSIQLNGGMSIHYDEALRGNPKEGRFLVASWQEI
jgi:hypothetical protein